MSDQLAASLSKFTPDASGLDRDALLFAAGRASVRPNRLWMTLAGGLLTSQIITLAIIWFQTTPAVGVSPRVPETVMVPTPPPLDEPAERELPRYWPLLDKTLTAEGDLPAPRPVEPLMPSAPPLHAFAEPPSSLLQ